MKHCKWVVFRKVKPLQVCGRDGLPCLGKGCLKYEEAEWIACPKCGDLIVKEEGKVDLCGPCAMEEFMLSDAFGEEE